MADLRSIFIERAQATCPTIIFPEADSETVALAGAKAAELGVCKSVLMGDADTIRGFVGDVDVTIIDIDADTALVEELAAIYAEREDFPLEVAIDMMSSKINFACMYVAAGKADGIVCGYTCPTAEAVSAGQEFIGLAEGAAMPNAYVIVEPDNFDGGEDGMLVFADPVMVVQPNSEELACIATNTAASVEKLLGWEPRIAFLSYSTKGSGGSADAEKVRKAVEIAREKRPDLLMDGELQLDSAIVPGVSEKKIKGENVLKGTANILVFPDCDAGNITVKSVSMFANGGGTFAVMCGFAKPMGEISRRSDVDGMVFSTAVTAAQC
ncbi:phosphate acyltransferase [Adlercreutzia sp. ZJ473]|uniref:phosphate acyltransferase n=1 Tax=Adlercreutzia sp. ZJ473 TaxID=2722822 RepID=UPI001552CDDC|nr:phosphate acyltransferase [Adlercreutzia sp. ZJ473]